MPQLPAEHAFPSTGHPGLSKRDYFAAAAMAALLSQPQSAGIVHHEGQIANAAYKYADAMVAESGR